MIKIFMLAIALLFLGCFNGTPDPYWPYELGIIKNPSHFKSYGDIIVNGEEYRYYSSWSFNIGDSVLCEEVYHEVYYAEERIK